MTGEMVGFAEMIGLEAAVSNRYSALLLLGLYGGLKSEQLNPAKVVNEVRALEGIAQPSSLKGPIRFKYPPLKGLWHKHYLPDGLPTMTRNVQNALRVYGLPYFRTMIDEARATGEQRFVTAEHVRHIANDAVHGNLQRRIADHTMTGEWIIYAKHEGENYYLCLATHDEATHALVRQQINAICCKEFPFLSALLASA